MDQLGVIRKRPDQGMLGDELELLLLRGGFRSFQQIADVAQPMGAVPLSHLTGLFDHFGGMAMRETDQPHHHAQGVNPPAIQDIFSPLAGVGTDGAGLVHPPGRAAFDPAALLGNDVTIIGGEASRLVLNVDGNLPKLRIKEPDDVPVPAPRWSGRGTPAAPSNTPWPPPRGHHG